MACHLTGVNFAHVDVGVFVNDAHRFFGSFRTIFWRTNRAGIEHALQTEAKERLCVVDGLA